MFMCQNEIQASGLTAVQAVFFIYTLNWPSLLRNSVFCTGLISVQIRYKHSFLNQETHPELRLKTNSAKTASYNLDLVAVQSIHAQSSEPEEWMA